MMRYLLILIHPVIFLYKTFFWVTLEKENLSKYVSKKNPDSVLRKSFEYLISVIGVSYLLWSIMINYLTGLSISEFYYTIQSLFIYASAYMIIIILMFFFTEAKIKTTIAILNFLIGSGHLVQTIFIFIAISVVLAIASTGYISNVTVDLSDWDNIDKTYQYFLIECSTDKYFFLKFLFAANYILTVKQPFGLIILINPAIIFIYTIIASNIFSRIFSGSKIKYTAIAVLTFVITYAIWNIAHLYAMTFVQNPSVCGDEAADMAQKYTGESMVKKLYGKIPENKKDSFFVTKKIDVYKLHITRHIGIKRDNLDAGSMMQALDRLKNATQEDICTEDFYSDFRNLGVSVTEIYYSKSGDRIGDFTVSANTCQSSSAS